MCPSFLGFFFVVLGSNSGVCAYEANTLLTELHPQSAVFRKFKFPSQVVTSQGPASGERDWNPATCQL